MRGWFDAFRHDGGPTLYDHANRTAVTGDVPTITLCVVFITLFAAFLVIFPGIRKERLTTFTIVTLSLFVGAVILVGGFGSEWHTADKQIISAYRAFSSEKIVADLGIHIGFNHVNVTLRTGYLNNSSDRIDYNERFTWDGPGDMVKEYDAALHKGLPYPILTVAEYLSLDEEGFGWGRVYRSAGYFSAIALWSSFASWLLMNILLVVVPRYGAYMMVLTGGLMLSTNVLYHVLTPSRPLVIRFEDVLLTFSYGWCFWLVLSAGLLCCVTGLVIALVEVIFPHKFSTILELDYDTPYDRHIIIEESHHTKQKKRRTLSDEPFSSSTFGSKIFRRLSKRGGGGSERDGQLHPNGDPLKFGIVNPAMEMMDPPKSPWRYPHRTFSAPMRSESRKSTKSVNFRDLSVIYGATLHPPPSPGVAGMMMMPPDSAADVVSVIPDVHVSIPIRPPEIESQRSVRSERSERSERSDSSSASSDEESDDEGGVERHQHPMTSVVNVDFQSQFRGRVSRQGSASSASSPPTVHWDQTVLPGSHSRRSSGDSHISGSSKSSSRSSGSGSSTPRRKLSNESDQQELNRAASQRQSGLASISARISAAAQADRSRSRRNSGDDSFRVDMW